MKLKDEIQYFFMRKDVEEMIMSEDLEGVYSLFQTLVLSNKFSSSISRKDLTTAFWKMNIEPLNYLEHVPADYMAGYEYDYNVKIPDGYTQIATNAFGASGISECTIPRSMKRIDSSAFSYCYDLSNIYYLGTTEEWSRIGIAEDAFEEVKNCAIHCVDGVIKINV